MKRSVQGTAGFTLIEMLVATSLMGVVLAVLAMITSHWLPNWSRGFVRVQRSGLLFLALDRLVSDVAAAEFVTRSRDNPHPFFEGTESTITFIRTALGPNIRSGLEVVQFSETTDRLGTALVRSRAPFFPVAIASEPLLLRDPVPLLRAPYRVSFSYAGPDRIWKSAWRQAAELPSAVRLTVHDTMTDRTLSVSTATVVHRQIPASCLKSKDDRRCGRTVANDAADENPMSESRSGRDR
jgi:general secretion pathway protein J